MSETRENLGFPIKKSIANIQAGAIVVAVLMAVMSLIGLIFTDRIYPTDELSYSYLTNDLINLLIGLPILLGVIWLARRGKLVGLLFWPGALLYALYNYTAMLVGVPFGWPTLVFAALVLLNTYLLFDLLRSIDGEAVQTRLKGAIFEKFSGGALALFGVLFFFLAAGVVGEAGASQAVAMPDVGVAVADMVLSAFLVAGGVLFFLRKPLGYAGGPGMLFAAMMLFIAVILVVTIRPYLSGAAFNWSDLIALGSMAIVCFIPFGLMTRGIVSKEKVM